MAPQNGFIKPGEIVCITVTRHFEDHSELDTKEEHEDLVFLKALPLNENHVTEHSLRNYIDSIEDEIFNYLNVDLMFNLEVLTIAYTDETVERPNYEELELAIEEPKHVTKEIDLVEESNSKSSYAANTLSKNNRLTKAESSDQVGDVSNRDDADNESKHLDNDPSHQSSVHQSFQDDEERVAFIPRQNSFVNNDITPSSKKSDQVKKFKMQEETKIQPIEPLAKDELLVKSSKPSKNISDNLSAEGMSLKHSIFLSLLNLLSTFLIANGDNERITPSSFSQIQGKVNRTSNNFAADISKEANGIVSELALSEHKMEHRPGEEGKSTVDLDIAETEAPLSKIGRKQFSAFAYHKGTRDLTMT